MRDERRWSSNGLKNVSIGLTSLQMDHFRLFIRGEGLRDGVKIWPIGRIGARCQVIEGHNSDSSQRTSVAMVLDGEMQRDVGDGFSFHRHQNR
jgi:hypothetical protein